MKKILTVLAAMVFIGAGCTSNTEPTQTSYSAEQQQVQATYDAFLATGLSDAPESSAAYMTQSIDDVEAAGIKGYFEARSSNLDWSKAEWSNGGGTVKLFSNDGIDVGVWSRDAEGNWKLTNKFWWGE